MHKDEYDFHKETKLQEDIYLHTKTWFWKQLHAKTMLQKNIT
jgi:hypothetical protein